MTGVEMLKCPYKIHVSVTIDKPANSQVITCVILVKNESQKLINRIMPVPNNYVG